MCIILYPCMQAVSTVTFQLLHCSLTCKQCALTTVVSTCKSIVDDPFSQSINTKFKVLLHKCMGGVHVSLQNNGVDGYTVESGGYILDEGKISATNLSNNLKLIWSGLTASLSIPHPVPFLHWMWVGRR